MDLKNLMAQAQQMQQRAQQVEEALLKLSVTGSAGGGMVTVEVDGKGNVKKVRLEPTVVNPADVEMLEDLITVATVDAQKKASEAAQREMRELMGGLNLPFQLPF
ncbi:MAG: YbaB/EbfC family nucleoid-associated protein [Gemmatimonadaceae bacterium]|nr:YbaB/EbfC family nucleoid-associated protein [Gemmatimonadaceae bacterium]